MPFVLAGSIRDDGPLEDVITDTLAAQLAYATALEGAGMCLMLAIGAALDRGRQPAARARAHRRAST